MRVPTVDLAQTEWEFEQLLDLLIGWQPRRILEVGIWEGGTLYEWLDLGSHVTAVDDTMRPPGPGEWQKWARLSACELELLHGSSHDESIVARAAELGPYDFAFIDADHRYDAVKADWDNYRPMIEPGGLVAFHDIVPRPDYGVDRLWAEIKTAHRTVEIVDGGSGRYNGIGIVYL